jgi:hypothetical protein
MPGLLNLSYFLFNPIQFFIEYLCIVFQIFLKSFNFSIRVIQLVKSVDEFGDMSLQLLDTCNNFVLALRQNLVAL